MYREIEYLAVTKFDLLATAVDSGEVVESASVQLLSCFISVNLYLGLVDSSHFRFSNTDSVCQHTSISHSLIIRENPIDGN